MQSEAAPWTPRRVRAGAQTKPLSPLSDWQQEAEHERWQERKAPGIKETPRWNGFTSGGGGRGLG